MSLSSGPYWIRQDHPFNYFSHEEFKIIFRFSEEGVVHVLGLILNYLFHTAARSMTLFPLDKLH